MKLKCFGRELLKLLLLGITVGLVISLYQFLAHEVIVASDFLFKNSSTICFGVVATLTTLYYLFLVWLNKTIPGYTGSGIPAFEGYQAGWYKFNPLTMLLMIFFNSLSAFFGGLTLGGEGPSISISGSLALLINKIFKQEDKELVATGTGAGFSTAFLAPVAGIIYLLEENKNLLSIRFLLKGLVVILLSFGVGRLVYNHNLLPIAWETKFDWQYFYILLIVVILGIGVSKLFIIAILFCKDFSKKNNWFSFILPVLGIVSIIAMRYFPYITGSGSYILDNAMLDLGLGILIVTLVGRIIATSLANSALISGGLTLPMLAIGILVGRVIGLFFAKFDPEIINQIGIFEIAGMIVVFAVMCNAPITALFLGLRVSSFAVGVLPFGLVVLLVYLFLKLVKQKSIYHLLEKRLTGYQTENVIGSSLATSENK